LNSQRGSTIIASRVLICRLFAVAVSFSFTCLSHHSSIPLPSISKSLTMTGHYYHEHNMVLSSEEFDGLFPPVTCQPTTSAPMYTPSSSSYPEIGQTPAYAQSIAPYPPQIPNSNYLSPFPGPYQPWTSQPNGSTTYASSLYPPPVTVAPNQTLNPASPLMSHYERSRSGSASSQSSYPPIAAEDNRPFGAVSYPARPISPGSPDLRAYGYPNADGSWSCAYEGCTSRAIFTRGCDLRKHYKRHTKSFFCRHEGCPQATGGGFSSKKDLARHEAKHNPGVICEFPGCDRVFSRVDNMVSLSRLVALPLSYKR
jgi:hypothetical protein